MSLKLNERYPGRFSNPSADYPQGSFKNRTSPAAKDGSYLEQDWANDKEGFFQSLLSAAGLEANGSVDRVGASQFFDAIQKLKQSQSGTAFPTTGPSAALVLTPVPAITAYAAGQRFRVKFNRASTGTDTINISGIGPKNLKQYDATGAKVAAIFAINQLADVEYDGADAVLLDQLPVNSLDDPWALQPIGVPIGLFTDIAPGSVPPTNKSYRYISLTAGDSYNAGVLTGETVTGTGPLLEALAVINLSGSPLNGKTIRLINTERRVLRAGLSGTVQGDQFQGFVFASADNQPLAYHNSGTSVPATGTNAGRESAFRAPDGSVWRAAIAVDDGTNGAPRIGTETRSKNIGVTIFLRIK